MNKRTRIIVLIIALAAGGLIAYGIWMSQHLA
jgi:hypothetical protein